MKKLVYKLINLEMKLHLCSSIKKQLTMFNVSMFSIQLTMFHSQTDIMELTLLLHLMMVSILKSKEILLVADGKCS